MKGSQRALRDASGIRASGRLGVSEFVYTGLKILLTAHSVDL